MCNDSEMWNDILLKELRQEMRVLNELNPFNPQALVTVALSITPWLLKIMTAQMSYQSWIAGLN